VQKKVGIEPKNWAEYTNSRSQKNYISSSVLAKSKKKRGANFLRHIDGALTYSIHF
jgi:hypothetical protein